MVTFKKLYHVHRCKTVIRHECKCGGYNFTFPEKVQTYDAYFGDFKTIKEAEKYIQKMIKIFKSQYYSDDEIVIKKDYDNKCIIVELYTANYSHYNINTNDDKKMKNKTKPFFTIALYYSICDTTFGYDDSETGTKQYDNFEAPLL